MANMKTMRKNFERWKKRHKQELKNKWINNKKKCEYCLKELFWYDDLAPGSYDGKWLYEFMCCFDHVIPLSRGGKNELSNLVVCCRHCNLIKGVKNVNS